MISISLAGRREPEFQKHFAVATPESLEAFAKTICRDIWSPIVWKSGTRLKADFQECGYVVLDFDSGTPSLLEIKTELAELGLMHILATTKSHQKEKVSAAGVKSPAVDRYRLVLKASEPCRGRELYEWNMGEYARWFGADVSCSDGARFYYPCQEVVSIGGQGKFVPWRPFDEDYAPEEYRYARRASRLAEMGRQGAMPRWVHAILSGEAAIEPGERHKTCFRLGANLADLGWDENSAVTATLKTRLADIGEADVRRAVRNGYNSAKK